ncbi:AraC family transcriptional regulator [Solimonas marina]|uniref:AraC family transcriptional regulator n=1 Tax=Solimonas marina TaxID=2714601 RepID=A0A969W7G0_9GAMM|nr:AraC family transcriptional regulator [Solimonas marina]NKF22091.1 AraC family transcriptional regulator [Solimonas marina]
MLHTTVLSSWGRAIRRALDAAGVDSARLFAEAGLDVAALADPDARYPLEQTTRLWALAVRETGDPAFGLSVATQVTQTTFHALGYALIASGTLREAFERMVRYFRLVTDAADLKLERDGDSYRFEVGYVPGVMPAPESVDAFISLFLRFCRSQLGREFSPLRVALRRARPAQVERFDAVLRCAIDFGAARNAVWFAAEPFERALPDANPELARHNDEVVVRYLAHFDRDNLRARVRAALIEALPGGEPSAQKIADLLHMSLRSLQRKLADEQATFAAMLAEVRHELARSYLRNPHYSIGEITFLLGFTDASAFARAFRRWEGCAPSAFRASGAPDVAAH